MKAVERRVSLRSIDPTGAQQQGALQAPQEEGKAKHFMRDRSFRMTGHPSLEVATKSVFNYAYPL